MPEVAPPVAIASGWSVPARRWLFRIAAATLTAWMVLLTTLALTTSNPVVVSPEQITRADAVIVARLDPAGQNQVTIDRVFKGALKTGDTIRVVNLPPDNDVRSGEPRVLALSRFRKDYRVTVLNDTGEIPPVVLVYPAVPAVFDQVRKLLPGNP